MFVVSKTDLTASKPYRASRRYAVFDSQRKLFAYILQNRDRECVYEVVYGNNFTEDPRYKHVHARRPRIYFDLEAYTDESNDAQWADKVAVLMRGIDRLVGFRVDWCVMDSSRACTKTGRYKHSTHLVARNLYAVDNTQTMKLFVEVLLYTLSPEELQAVSLGDDKTIIDAGVYTNHRNMRCLYGLKNAGDAAYMRCCRSQYPFKVFSDDEMKQVDPISFDCMIMKRPDKSGGDVVLTCKAICELAKRATRDEECANVLREYEQAARSKHHLQPLRVDLSTYVVDGRVSPDSPNMTPSRCKHINDIHSALQRWLETSRTSKKFNWTTARVKKVFNFDDTSVIFHVGFDRVGVPRTCPAGTKHSGGCGQNWLVSVRTDILQMQCKCFRTQDTGRKCGRRGTWQPICFERKEPGGRTRRAPVTLPICT